MSKEIKFNLHFEYDKTLKDIRKDIRARTI